MKLRRLTAAVLAPATSVVGLTFLAGAAAGSAGVSGTVTGFVFRDYSADGARGALEPGESGIVVTAHDAAGAAVGTATSASDGTYSLTVTSAADANVRLDFAIPAGKQGYLQAGPIGTDSQGAVRFATVGDTGVGFGVDNPNEYCQANPALVTGCLTYGNQQGPSASIAALRSFPYDATGAVFNSNATATPATIATHAQVGSTFAVEWSRRRSTVYSAAFQKQYAGFGPGGPGAVYRTVGGTTSVLATIPNAGTDARAAYPVNSNAKATTGDTWLNDPSYDDVGKVALGDIALTDDESTLWVVNLADRMLYPVATADGSIGTPVAVPLATGASVTCAAADVRPFALGRNDGLLYLGETCSAQSTQVAANLRFYVYAFDPTNATFGAAPVFEMAVTPAAHGKPGNSCNGDSGTWRPWANTAPFPTNCGFPQPWLVSLAFDRGNLILGVRDRFGDQSAADYPIGVGATTEGTQAGDLLRACGGPTSGWTLESNGSCGGVTTAGAGDAQGPGGGEYYFQDRFTTGTNHQETSNGGVVQVPGFPTVAYTVMDPDLGNGNDWRAGGVHYESNATGANDHWFQLYDKCDTTGVSLCPSRAANGTFGKSSGLGDLVALCNNAPVEIGNRVWFDANDDGVQDAGEAGLAGVTVTLYAANGTTVLATTATASDGTYVFSSDPTRTNATGRVYDLAALTEGAQVIVGAPTSTSVPSVGNVGLTAPGTTTGDVDSDVSRTTGKTALVTIGAPGHEDHDIDIGYSSQPRASVGDVAWIDADHDGVQNEPPSSGVNGVTVTLQTSGGASVLDVDGNAVAPQVTANDPGTGAPGHYLFTDLPAGSYRVVFSDLPAPYVVTHTDAGSDDAADSDGLTTAPVTVPAGGVDLTVDLGLFAPVSVGDLAWLDANGDGVQSPGEAGLPGVRVTLLDGSGNPVAADADGGAVAAVDTDASGHYLFTNLMPGTYKVRFAPPTGYSPTSVHAGHDTAVDSDAPEATSAALPPAASDLTLDAGFVPDARPVGSVACTVYVDANRNGRRDPDERALPGVTVQLLGADGAVVATTVTADDGTCRFDNIPPGSYRLRQVQPSGYTSTTPDDLPVDVLAGVTSADPGFGEAPAGLPRTGGPAGAVPLAALLLVALGAWLVWLDRPSRRRPLVARRR